MNNTQKRFILFLLGCIPTRLLLVYLTKNISLEYLPIFGYVALIPAVGFIYLYLSGSRKTGPEVLGEKIWWDNLRPIHSLFYFTFAYNAIYKFKGAWVYLLYDVIFGLTSFLIFHYINNDLKNLKL